MNVSATTNFLCTLVLSAGLLGCTQRQEPVVLEEPVVVESPTVEELRIMLKELSWSGMPLREDGQVVLSRLRQVEFVDPAKKQEVMRTAERMVQSIEPDTIKQLAKEILREIPEVKPASES